MINIFGKKNKVEQAPSDGWLGRLKKQLGKTRQKFTEQVANLFLGKKVIDAELFESLETLLLQADFGVKTTEAVLETLRKNTDRQQLREPSVLLASLKESLFEILKPCEKTFSFSTQPCVILMVGINGAGKTTTIGKLAHRFKNEGKSLMLAAGDTFRAAAVEQLQTWGERNQIPVISQPTGADSASVLFDAVQAATSRGVDVLLADTAGRLHNKSNLMDELKKVKRVIQKADPKAPEEIILVLDASIGQNALNQVKEFHEAVGVTSLIITKLDGTAKGGIIFSLAEQFKLPIAFVGVGEQIDDLQPFNAKDFVEALFEHINNTHVASS